MANNIFVLVTGRCSKFVCMSSITLCRAWPFVVNSYVIKLNEECTLSAMLCTRQTLHELFNCVLSNHSHHVTGNKTLRIYSCSDLHKHRTLAIRQKSRFNSMVNSPPASTQCTLATNLRTFLHLAVDYLLFT